MKIIKRKNKFYNTDRFGQPEIRVYHKKAAGNKSPIFLLKCGCCSESWKYSMMKMALRFIF